MSIARGIHPEVRVVAPDGATLKLDQVRKAHQELALRPAVSGWRVCILEEADRLTVEAGNALLSLLEEPPAHAILVLLAENGQAVLPTIRSRCHVLDFRPWPEGALAAHLEGETSTVPPRLAAALAQGNPGLALRLIKGEDLLAGRGRVERFLEQVLDGEPAKLYAIAAELETYTRDRRGTLDFLDVLQLCLRDLLVFRITADRQLLVNRDRVDWIAAMASRRQPARLLQVSAAVAQIREAVRQNVGRRLCLDLLIVRMLEVA
jgi:DNA polymerase-3 subunit delta'